MPPDSDHATENSADGTTPERTRFERRPLLKALGAGTALSLGAGIATARQDDARIDPVFGYAVRDASEVPDDFSPDHEVELVEAPPDPDANRPPTFSFAPTGLHVSSGDLVQFTVVTDDHTVTAYHPAHGFQRRVPDEVPPFSSPIVPNGGAWLYRFDREGVYDAYCGPHHPFRMVMRVVVGDVTEQNLPAYVDTFEGSEDPPLFAPFDRAFFERELNTYSDRNENVEWVWLTPFEMLSADALDPLRIRDAGSVSPDAVRDEIGRSGAQTTTG